MFGYSLAPWGSIVRLLHENVFCVKSSINKIVFFWCTTSLYAPGFDDVVVNPPAPMSLFFEHTRQTEHYYSNCCLFFATKTWNWRIILGFKQNNLFLVHNNLFINKFIHYMQIARVYFTCKFRTSSKSIWWRGSQSAAPMSLFFERTREAEPYLNCRLFLQQRPEPVRITDSSWVKRLLTHSIIKVTPMLSILFQITSKYFRVLRLLLSSNPSPSTGWFTSVSLFSALESLRPIPKHENTDRRERDIFSSVFFRPRKKNRASKIGGSEFVVSLKLCLFY